MKCRLVALVLLIAPAMSPAWAATLSCPDLATAVPVGSCPGEEELRYTYTGYCSDPARLYETDSACASYEQYRRLKNIALWEAGDGGFQAYLSCDLPSATIRAARASKIAVSTRGKMTRLVCSYQDGIIFTHRKKGNCKVEGDGDCAAGPAACQATCD